MRRRFYSWWSRVGYDYVNQKDVFRGNRLGPFAFSNHRALKQDMDIPSVQDILAGKDPALRNEEQREEEVEQLIVPTPLIEKEDTNAGSVAFMITRDMKMKMLRMGYTQSDVSYMTPAVANEIIVKELDRDSEFSRNMLYQARLQDEETPEYRKHHLNLTVFLLSQIPFLTDFVTGPRLLVHIRPRIPSNKNKKTKRRRETNI
eukprot:TRINITY_DN1179_c0_g1_i1.p1 TRINITY_DN1179_c0_g1~~TRINITY_DN1179_c0_g1_i1.p1  ORF type:complete len:203 (-),score=42.43 TRINITY_DN1179_c0_g1_i1:25-633(-)